MTTTNEAAERLRCGVCTEGLHERCRNRTEPTPMPSSTMMGSGTTASYCCCQKIRDALAAERRATVERIRLEVRLSAFAANARYKDPAYREVIAILDKEAGA